MKYHGPVDPTTGKALYQPETGRAPRNMSRNKEGMPIGDYLYTAARDLQRKKEVQQEMEDRAALEEAAKVHALSKWGGGVGRGGRGAHAVMRGRRGALLGRQA